MAFERKDWIPTSLALLALGFSVLDIKNRWVGWVLMFLAFACLVIYYATREQHSPALTSMSEEARRRKRAEAATRDLKSAHGAINAVYFSFIKASNDDEIALAVGEYGRWLNETCDTIRKWFNDAEAEVFRELGPLLSVAIAVDNPHKSDYRWGEKERYMQRLDAYRPRLAALMQKASAS